MAKLSKKFSIAIFCVFALILGALSLTGCGKVDASIKFMVPENGAGEYKLFADVKVNDNGTFTLPEEPNIYGYVFRNWYIDSECQTQFESEKVKQDTTVYALLDEVKIAVSIKDGAGKEVLINEQALIRLDDLKDEHTALAKEQDLTFDSWYTNAECTTPYNKESGSVKLYAQYVANVTFDNGYEVLKEEKVLPGKTIEKPSVNEIKKNYMDEEDIYFVDENNVEFDFNAPITKNTKVRVVWKTPGLEVVPIEGCAEYKVNGFGTRIDKIVVETYPVISIPGKVTIDGEVKDVASCYLSNIYLAKSARKIIINEGVQYVLGLSSGPVGSAVEVVDLPASLRILEDSINGYTKLKEVNMKEGLEVILGSFWADKDWSSNRHTGYTIDVKVPSTVNNISLVPNTLKYAEGSVFKNDGNFVYKNDATLGKVLVSVIDSEVVNGRLVLPEGIEAIQVGALYNLSYDYLILPKSFKKVSYNNERSNYPYYTGSMLTNSASVEANVNPIQDKKMSVRAYSIVSDLDEHKYVSVNASALPEGMNKYAFNDSRKAYDELEQVNLVFVGEITEGQVNVTISYINPMADAKAKEAKLKVNVGEKITKEQVLTTCKITLEDLGYEFVIEELTQFGLDFDFDKALNANQYINVVYKFASTGVTHEVNEDGTVTITGFDKATAQKLENGTYLVAIPKDFDGKEVVAIKESAFEGNAEISKVYVPYTVKTIGAKAFRDTKNLDFVSIANGGLEVIGEKAFEYAGSMEVDGKRVCNPDLTKYDYKKEVPSLRLEFPLETVKDIQKDAFNSPAIREFVIIPEESSRAKFGMFNMDMMLKGKYEVGKYYFHQASTNVGIIKYTNISSVPDANGEIVHDVDYVATAAGYNGTSKFSFGLVLKNGMNNSGYIRYTVKEGSFALYEQTVSLISFSIIKKVEKGAFTYLNDFYVTNRDSNEKSKFRYMQKDGDTLAHCFTTETQITTQDPTIFEEGWFAGKTNAETLVFLAAADCYGGNTPGM